MVIVWYILYIVLFHYLIHFVDKEFEFVDLPIEIGIPDMLLNVTVVVGLVIVIHIIGIIMIKSVIFY